MNIIQHFRIYTTMIGRKSSLKPLQNRLQRFGDDVKIMISVLNQGKTKRWMLAWTFSKSVSLTTIVSDFFPSKKLIALGLQDRPISFQCPKPGLTRLMQEISILNGRLRQEDTLAIVAEFKCVTWTNQRARKRAKAILSESSIKKAKWNFSNVACQVAFGAGDGKDSYTDAGNFVSSESIPTNNLNAWDNASQAYFPLPNGEVPGPIIRIRIQVFSEDSYDSISFELISGSKQHLHQLVQYLKNLICR